MHRVNLNATTSESILCGESEGQGGEEEDGLFNENNSEKITHQCPFKQKIHKAIATLVYNLKILSLKRSGRSSSHFLPL
jgi:hypothetical protein